MGQWVKPLPSKLTTWIWSSELTPHFPSEFHVSDGARVPFPIIHAHIAILSGASLLQFPALLYLLPWRPSVLGRDGGVKPNKSVLSQVAFAHGLFNSNRKPTRTKLFWVFFFFIFFWDHLRLWEGLKILQFRLIVLKPKHWHSKVLWWTQVLLASVLDLKNKEVKSNIIVSIC